MNGRVLHMALILVSSAVVFSACRKESALPAAPVETRDLHADAIREFVSAPKRFQEVVATIRDEASYDRSAPGLGEVVKKFRDSAAAFRKLAPPGEVDQAKYRQMIADGFRGTEPTGKDMISLVVIKSREKEVAQWMEEFVAAGREAGAEALRLYGKIDYSGDAAEPATLQLGEGEVVPLPAPPPRRVDEAGGGSNPLLQHLGREPAEEDR